MCLAIPGKVKMINGQVAVVEYPNEVRKVLIGEKKIRAGDWVLVQMGVIIDKISKKETEVILKTWSKLPI